ESTGVRAEAERMAMDELARVNGLRAARRLAWHESLRRDAARARRLRTITLDEFRHDCAREEAALSALHAAIAEMLARDGHAAAEPLARAAEEEAASAQALAGDVQLPGRVASLPDGPAVLLDLALERAEAAAEFYLLA